MKTQLTQIAAGLLLASAAGLASAATANTTFNVIATVKSACTASAPTLNFGTFDPSLGTALTGSTTLSVFCTKTTPFTVALNVGLAANGGAFTGRIMKEAGGATLTYNLYTTAGLTTVWGDGSGSTGTQSGTGNGTGTAVPFTVFGNIPSQPNATPSTTYSDTITVTVTY